MTSAALIAVAVAGAGYAFYVGGDVLRGGSTVDFARGDLSKYGAAWWSYLVPPAGAPVVVALRQPRAHQAGDPRLARAAGEPRVGA